MGNYNPSSLYLGVTMQQDIQHIRSDRANKNLESGSPTGTVTSKEIQNAINDGTLSNSGAIPAWQNVLKNFSKFKDAYSGSAGTNYVDIKDILMSEQGTLRNLAGPSSSIKVANNAFSGSPFPVTDNSGILSISSAKLPNGWTVQSATNRTCDLILSNGKGRTVSFSTASGTNGVKVNDKGVSGAITLEPKGNDIIVIGGGSGVHTLINSGTLSFKNLPGFSNAPSGSITFNVSGPLTGWLKSKQTDGSTLYVDPNAFGISGMSLLLDETRSGIELGLNMDPPSSIEAEITPKGAVTYSLSLYSGKLNQNTLLPDWKTVNYDWGGHIIPPPSGVSISGLFAAGFLPIDALIDQDVDIVNATIKGEKPQLIAEGQAAKNAASDCISNPGLNSAQALCKAVGTFGTDADTASQYNLGPLFSGIDKSNTDASGYLSDFTTTIIGGAQGHDHEGPDTPIDLSYDAAVISGIEANGDQHMSGTSWGVSKSDIKNLINYINQTIARPQGDEDLNKDGAKIEADLNDPSNLYAAFDNYKKRASNNKDLNPANIGPMNELGRDIYDLRNPSVPKDSLGLLKHEIDVTNIDLSMGSSAITSLGSQIEGYAQAVVNDKNKKDTAQYNADVSGLNSAFNEDKHDTTTGGPNLTPLWEFLGIGLPLILEFVPWVSEVFGAAGEAGELAAQGVQDGLAGAIAGAGDVGEAGVGEAGEEAEEVAESVEPELDGSFKGTTPDYLPSASDPMSVDSIGPQTDEEVKDTMTKFDATINSLGSEQKESLSNWLSFNIKDLAVSLKDSGVPQDPTDAINSNYLKMSTNQGLNDTINKLLQYKYLGGKLIEDGVDETPEYVKDLEESIDLLAQQGYLKPMIPIIQGIFFL